MTNRGTARLLLVAAFGACGGTPGSSPDSGTSGLPAAIAVSATARTPRASTWSLGYWTWAPSYGASVAGTEAKIAALAPPLIRIGCYNNDANVPDPFDHAELDKAAAYARATGAELILQVPLLATSTGARPTGADAAEMVSYANVSKGYAIKYVSIGNEPDLYPDQGGLTDPEAQPAVPGYTHGQYCTEARAFAAAIKGVDPTIQIVGPDLGYKYQPSFGSSFDWLTPILEDCGDVFDIVAIHRYPFESLAVTTDLAAADRHAFRAVIEDVRQRMAAAGAGAKPLAITEANLAYIASPTGNADGSLLGTVPHGLWLVDFLATSAELGLWTATVFHIAGPDEFALGLLGLPPDHAPRPTYHALALYAAHAGSIMLDVTSDRADVHAYASRDDASAVTHVIAVNWGTAMLSVAVEIVGQVPADRSVTAVVPGRSVSAIEIPDSGSPRGWTYGDTQLMRGTGPEAIAVGAR